MSDKRPDVIHNPENSIIKPKHCQNRPVSLHKRGQIPVNRVPFAETRFHDSTKAGYSRHPYSIEIYRFFLLLFNVLSDFTISVAQYNSLTSSSRPPPNKSFQDLPKADARCVGSVPLSQEPCCSLIGIKQGTASESRSASLLPRIMTGRAGV